MVPYRMGILIRKGFSIPFSMLREKATRALYEGTLCQSETDSLL